MTHIPEANLLAAVEAGLRQYHSGATVETGEFYVRGGRFADMRVTDRPHGRRAIAVEVENGVGEYKDALGQATHYRRAGYVPVVAMPVVVEDLADPDTDTGETLNVCADAHVGLLGLLMEQDAHGAVVEDETYILRPFN